MVEFVVNIPVNFFLNLIKVFKMASVSLGIHRAEDAVAGSGDPKTPYLKGILAGIGTYIFHVWHCKIRNPVFFLDSFCKIRETEQDFGSFMGDVPGYAFHFPVAAFRLCQGIQLTDHEQVRIYKF